MIRFSARGAYLLLVAQLAGACWRVGANYFSVANNSIKYTIRIAKTTVSMFRPRGVGREAGYCSGPRCLKRD